MRALGCGLGRSHGNNNPVAFGPHGVRVKLIEIQDNSRHGRIGAVLRCAYPGHTEGIDRYFIGSTPATDCAGEIEQDSIRVDRRLNRRLYWRTEHNFHAQIFPLPRDRHLAHSRGPSCVLRHGARHCKHKSSEMFGNCRHVGFALASAPPFPALPLTSFCCKCRATVP
jgi:hypothetical protein